MIDNQPTTDDYLCIGTRMAQELQEFIDEAEACVTAEEYANTLPGVKALIAEWDEIVKRSGLDWRQQIEAIYWPDSGNELGRCTVSNETTLLELSATYHGDRDEFWIIELHDIGGGFKEVARHNPRHLESIKWA